MGGESGGEGVRKRKHDTMTLTAQTSVQQKSQAVTNMWMTSPDPRG